MVSADNNPHELQGDYLKNSDRGDAWQEEGGFAVERPGVSATLLTYKVVWRSNFVNMYLRKIGGWRRDIGENDDQHIYR